MRPSKRIRFIAESVLAALAATTSRSFSDSPSAPQLPTRTSVRTPYSLISSCAYIDADGMPIPVPCTETRRPWYVPVKPNMLRTFESHLASSRYVSAIHLARNGSPGSSTRSAISPCLAPMCVLMVVILPASGTLLGGGVSERPKEHASKACEGVTPPRVRIPAPPPRTRGDAGQAVHGLPGVSLSGLSFGLSWPLSRRLPGRLRRRRRRGHLACRWCPRAVRRPVARCPGKPAL